MRRAIGIFVISQFHIQVANGGAENICRQVAIAASEFVDVVVFHAERDNRKTLGKIIRHSPHISSINAFYLEEYMCNSGEISPELCAEAHEMLRKCKLVLCFERVLKNLLLPQLCVLGGVSYIHCEQVARSTVWKKLIVPSIFVKNKCVALGADEEKIEVIFNGIDCKKFYSYNSECTHVALLPFRPDAGKGFLESIDFVHRINQLSYWGKYQIMITKQYDNDFSDLDFYEKINAYASKKQVDIKYIPWNSQDTMNEIYNDCDFVLLLGSLEEGFGLTTIESIMSGRPVVARKIGATPEIIPEGYGVIFVNKIIDDASLIQIMESLKGKAKYECLKFGSDFIRVNYDTERMKTNYCKFLLEFLKGDL